MCIPLVEETHTTNDTSVSWVLAQLSVHRLMEVLEFVHILHHCLAHSAVVVAMVMTRIEEWCQRPKL